MTPDELEKAGVKIPYPDPWIWILCWPIALFVSIVTVWKNWRSPP